jgi:putative CRISPR-associated protein (TIGR02620 family)
MPTTWFVSRHAGAHDWMRAQSERGALGFGVDRYVQHLDPATPAPGDLVVGTLPFIDVLRLRERKVRFLALALDLPEDVRGRELSADEMASYGARLLDVDLQLREDTLLAAPGRLAAAPGKDLPELRLAFVSDQLTPLYLAARQHAERIRHMVLFATGRMAENAAELIDALKEGGPLPYTIEIVGLDQNGEDYPRLLEAVRQHVHRLCAAHPETRLVADLTGGTKPMALALAAVVAERRQQGLPARSVYTNTGAGTFQTILPVLPDEAISFRLSLREAIRAQGLQIDCCDSDGHGWRTAVQSRADMTGTLANLDDLALGALNKLVHKLPQEVRDGRNSAKYPAFVSVTNDLFVTKDPTAKATARNALLACLQHARKLGLIEIQPADSANPSIGFRSRLAVRYLGGTWLEEWLWLRLAPLADRIDDFAVGVHVSEIRDSSVRNELDAVLVHDNRMLVIEAKTGNMAQQKDNPLLYELDSKGNRLAQVFGTRLMVSARAMGDAALRRALHRKVSVICRQQIWHGRIGVLGFDAFLPMIENWLSRGQLADETGKRSPFEEQARSH